MAISIIVNAAGSTSDAPSYPLQLAVSGLGPYASGGIAVKAAIEAKLERAYSIVSITGRGGGYVVGEYDIANDLLKIYDAGTGAEVADTTVIASQSFQLNVLGK